MPLFKSHAGTVTLAVAVPLVEVKVAEPRGVGKLVRNGDIALKSTVPVGEPLLETGVTVAVTTSESFRVAELRFDDTDTVTALVGRFHRETKLSASMDPHPVVMS